jgi:HlyD family secretion protein
MGMARRGKLAIAAITAACLVAWLAYQFRGQANTAPVTDRQPLARQIANVGALGRVEPGSEIVNLGAGNLGGAPQDRLAALFVERGEIVRKGQVLGYLSGRAAQVAQRDVLQAQLDEAKAQLQTETALDRQRIAAAEIHQRSILEVTPSRIAAQQADVATLQTTLDDDKDLLNINTRLYPLGVATRRARDSQQAIVREDESKLAAARAHLAELNQQFAIDQIDAAHQIAVAQATAARARADLPIASLQSQLALAEERIKNLTLYAPIDGRILNVMALPGDTVGAGPILAIGDTSHMRVVAEVYETDIGRVGLRQTATITSRALARPLTGKVVRIGDMIFKNDVLQVDPAARVDARVVQVWIALDDPAPVARLTNLTVDVLIQAAEAPVAAAAMPDVAGK